MANDWWAKKLNAPAPQAQPVQPQPVYQQPQRVSTPPVQQTVPITERCPGCGSGNYGGATPEARKRCYDCGYPLQQSGSGMGTGISTGQPAAGPTTPAKQVSTANNFNPQGIIGHI